MINHLPDRLDLIATAEAGRKLRGTVSIGSLERLLPVLVSDEGELQVEMELGKDPDGTRYLAGSIRGEVLLRCQRCLDKMTLPLDLNFRLGLVSSDAAAGALPDRFEPLLVTAEPAHIADVIAEEVLLAIPIVPRHSDRLACQEFVRDYTPPESEQRKNPFAVLAGLKLKQ
ncbi:MAG: YceD family protein [Gammaproteobacteria bacterium]|jgi:uncharacterized protein